jgi:hypothetical protein
MAIPKDAPKLDLSVDMQQYLDYLRELELKEQEYREGIEYCRQQRRILEKNLVMLNALTDNPVNIPPRRRTRDRGVSGGIRGQVIDLMKADPRPWSLDELRAEIKGDYHHSALASAMSKATYEGVFERVTAGVYVLVDEDGLNAKSTGLPRDALKEGIMRIFNENPLDAFSPKGMRDELEKIGIKTSTQSVGQSMFHQRRQGNLIQKEKGWYQLP